jgi:hypothetical protein
VRRKTAPWIAGTIGGITAASVLLSGYGALALGVALVTSTIVARTIIGTDDASLRLLRGIVPLLLLGGVILCVTATKTYRPDPFGLAVGSDVYAHCGSVLHPEDNDYGCESWRNARAFEATWLLVLAVVFASAAAIDWFVTRKRAREPQSK